MNTHALGYITGFVVGVLIVAVVILLMTKLFKKDLRDKYDEMQELIRGRAYKYAFFAMCVYEVIACYMSSLEDTLFFGPVVTHVGAILVGVTVQVTYCIWHNAYFGINTPRSRYAALFVIIGLLNVLSVAPAAIKGELFVNGQFQPLFSNLIVAFLFVLIGIELLIKHFVDKGKTEEED